MSKTDLSTRCRNILLDTAWLSMGYASFNRLPEGISFSGSLHPAKISFFSDLTWVDADGSRHMEQQVFDEFFRVIREAREVIVIDMFLFNDFLGLIPEQHRLLCDEMTDLLIEKRSAQPDIQVIFITDPINTVYGGIENQYLQRLEDCGVRIVVTDLDQLRDSNPIYSFFWRLFIRPFGNRKDRGWLPSPFSNDRITLRSYLKLFNLKANHRKTLIADDGNGGGTAMICTGNPHNGSSAHSNVAIRFNGPAVLDLFQTEAAVLQMAGMPPPNVQLNVKPVIASDRIQVLTEKKIKQSLLNLIDSTQSGDAISLILFYLSDTDLIHALKAAHTRGVLIRLILDPNKDAFGLPKSGIPNRPVARVLHQHGIAVRWADTHGEQCHSKLLLVSRPGEASALLVGSANFTRRNLDDFNLETDALILAPRDSAVVTAVETLFDRLWHNETGRTYSAEYGKYSDPGRWRYLLYWLMEKTGISTF